MPQNNPACPFHAWLTFSLLCAPLDGVSTDHGWRGTSILMFIIQQLWAGQVVLMSWHE